MGLPGRKINCLILFHLEVKNKLVICLENPKILEKKFFKDKEKRIGYLFSRKVNIFWMRSPHPYTQPPDIEGVIRGVTLPPPPIFE